QERLLALRRDRVGRGAVAVRRRRIPGAWQTAAQELPVLLRRQSQRVGLCACRLDDLGPATWPPALALRGLREIPAARRRQATRRQVAQGGVLLGEHRRGRLYGPWRELASVRHRSCDLVRRPVVLVGA